MASRSAESNTPPESLRRSITLPVFVDDRVSFAADPESQAGVAVPSRAALSGHGWHGPYRETTFDVVENVQMVLLYVEFFFTNGKGAIGISTSCALTARWQLAAPHSTATNMGCDISPPSTNTMCQQDNDDAVAAGGRAEGPFPWHIPVFDAHCHPTDTMASVASLATMRAAGLTIMATRSQDQHLVADVATSHGEPGGGCSVVPSFGWHPWFSHQLYDDAGSSTYVAPQDDSDEALHAAKKAHYTTVLAPSREEDDEFIRSLPTPVPLSSFLADTRTQLDAFPGALVGEIGLDKAFRVPMGWDGEHKAARDDGLTPGGREGRLLSPYRVRMEHQAAILAAQLRLAGGKGRPVSLHGVQAHGILHQVVSDGWKGYEKRVKSAREKKQVAPGAESDSDSEEEEGQDKPFPPRICLHSYSGAVESLPLWLHKSIPAKIYFSFSTAVNLGTDMGRRRFEHVVAKVPDDKILVESDLHVAGEGMDAALEDMYRRVCHVKGWALEEGVRRIGHNYKEFVLGQAD